jgi:hypothetical protein
VASTFNAHKTEVAIVDVYQVGVLQGGVPLVHVMVTVRAGPRMSGGNVWGRRQGGQ